MSKKNKGRKDKDDKDKKKDFQAKKPKAHPNAPTIHPMNARLCWQTAAKKWPDLYDMVKPTVNSSFQLS